MQLSYSKSLRQQGRKLHEILNFNNTTETKLDDIRLVEWRNNDLKLLKNATIQYVNELEVDLDISPDDRSDYKEIMSDFRKYTGDNFLYWNVRAVNNKEKYHGWKDNLGNSWDLPSE